MKRAVIIAKGEVQRVGYGDTVEKIARKLKLTGFVENLKPYQNRCREGARCTQFIHNAYQDREAFDNSDIC